MACRSSSSLGYLAPPASSDARLGLGQLGASLERALATEYRAQTERTAPPIGLVPTDGSELVLRALDARVTIDGPLARTEIHFTFHNAEPRVREGRFGMALPAGAAVARFAMKVNGEWRESRVVSREKGRVVYERFLQRGIDPALLEQDQGNRFSARVFPIVAGEHKELVLAYEEQVSAARPYTLALAGLPVVDQLAIAIVHDGDLQRIDRRAAAPEDVTVDIARGTVALADGEAFVARIEGDTATSEASLSRVLFLVDTSASRATVMGKQAALLRRLIDRLPPDEEIAVMAYDHAPRELFRGRAREAVVVESALFAHGALGASDLGAALGVATTAGMRRVVVIGDGAPTLGETDAARLAAIIKDSAIDRVDAIQIGDTIDRDTLAPVVAAGRQPGAILDGRDPARTHRQLSRSLAAAQRIAVAGARTWPATTRGIAPGEPIWVFGLRPAGESTPLAIRIGDRAFDVTPRKGDAVRVRRSVARAELGALTERLGVAPAAERAAIAAQIEELALAHALVSARTSLIVLETDEDERRELGIESDAPRIDPTATSQGITIDRNYIRNIPVPGRTFDAALGTAAGEQGDGLGVSFAGATSLESEYYVDGINTGGGGEAIAIAAREDPTVGFGGRRDMPHVRADTMSPLALDLVAEHQLNRTAFALDDGYIEPARPAAEEEPRYATPYTGPLHDVMASLARSDRERAFEIASKWQLEHPGDVAAIIALGEALEARGAGALAARAYGSLLDLYPNRAELLRAAGERADRAGARAVAIDAYRRAIRERPDHVSTYRLLAYALLRADRGDEALDAIAKGMARSQVPSITEILAGDAGLIAAHLIARDPARRRELSTRMLRGVADKPSVRVVLAWETDANDVDLHVRDARGGHAYYKSSQLASGGVLLDDVTTGWGPEMFVAENPRAYPYRISAHYYRKGPMGIGLGTAQVIFHDGRGMITVEDRPFVIQNDDAMVELGTVRAPR